ncbi:MAG TPA: RDD family protein [Dermatophilaceae bacterium]
MVDRKDVASWLGGPGAARPDSDDYPGRRLGMPEHGPGSLARFGRRLVAVCVDWVVCTVIAAGLMHYRLGEGGLGPFKPLAVFVLMNLLLVGTLGSTIGHRLLGIRVVRIGGATAGPLLAGIRTVLLAVVIPAVIWDRDTRGFHDKIAGTVTVRL